MKIRPFLSLTLIFITIGSSVGFFFPDTPDGWRKKNQFEDYTQLLWDSRIVEESVIMNAPSFGYKVTILGRVMDDGIHSFQGIKYANAERFQIPENIDTYDDYAVIDAQDFGYKCPQSRRRQLDEDEHCQHINVYTPKHPSEITSKLPVMVFIHGGAFVAGSSNGFLPGRLVPHDVILATINYRLGALGFFTQNTNEAPGDYALYDQRHALRWVRDHIGDFGGDNESITVFGESAGSVSVSYMTIVADSDTIHRAISESGTFSEVWSVDMDPLYAANYIANKVGCLDNDTVEIDMECMKEADQFDLTAAELELVAEDRKNGLMGFRGAAPTIQPENLNDTIVTRMPQEYYEDQDFNDIPYMLGTNKDEGSLITLIVEFAYLRPNGLFHDREYLREQAITDVLGSFGVKDPSHGLSNSLILEYCQGVDLGYFWDAAPCLIDMFGVLFLKAGGWKVANLHSNLSTQETYHYSFEYDVGPGFIGEYIFYDTGVTHGEELEYLFPYGEFDDNVSQTVSDRMCVMWTNFAKKGDPTPDDETNWKDLDIPKFIPYIFEDHHYMLLREEFIMQTEFPLRWTIRYDEEVAGHELTMEPPYETEASMTTDGSSTDGSSTDGSSTDDASTDGTSKDSSSTEELTPEEPHREDPESRVGPQKAEGPAISPSFKTQEDVDDMEKKRDAYMITMIVFIVTYCLATGAAIYFFMITRRKSMV